MVKHLFSKFLDITIGQEGIRFLSMKVLIGCFGATRILLHECLALANRIHLCGDFDAHQNWEGPSVPT